jgi:hypothetical protein
LNFGTAEGEALAISVPAGETRVLKHFQDRMPYGLFVQGDTGFGRHLLIRGRQAMIATAS